MDLTSFIPDRLYLTDEAFDTTGTVHGFLRRVTNRGKERAISIFLHRDFKEKPLVTVIAQRLDDGRWRVTCISFNVPRLVFGHNGRAIRSPDKLALALTRLRYFVAQVVRPECWGRIIPGIGADNLGFVRRIEIMVQAHDPGHNLLIASHLARYRWQHKPSLICWGQSTRTKRRELSFSFYDKIAEAQGWPEPEGPLTRVECIVKGAERLATEAQKTGLYQGMPGKVVATLSVETAYAILRRNLGEFSGFGTTPEVVKTELSKTARTLLAGIGNRLREAQVVDFALEQWRRMEGPRDRTLREITTEVRAFAFASTVPDAADIIPAEMSDLQWADVRHPFDDQEFDAFLRDTGAPLIPDTDILAAWSKTTLLREKPTCELVGTLFAKGVPGKPNLL